MNIQAMLDEKKESRQVNEILLENTDKNNNGIGDTEEATSLFPSIEIPSTILPWKKQNGVLPTPKKFKRRKGNLDDLLPKVEAKKLREQSLILQTNKGDTLSSSSTREPLHTVHDHHPCMIYSPTKKQLLDTNKDICSSTPYGIMSVTPSHIPSYKNQNEKLQSDFISSTHNMSENEAVRQISVTHKNNTKGKNVVVLKNKQQNQSKLHAESKTNKRTLSANERYSKLTNSQLQRRLVANARERSRVHALSNAFNSLRCAIPSYSTEQRLSKLTILRVAINYINALENILEQDPQCCSPTAEFAKFVDECSSVLQTEYGRSKSKHGME